MNCIIHYENRNNYSTIKKLSQRNIERILEAKEKRTKLAGDFEHKDQIRQIPDEIDENLHGIHLNPCYKRFTVVLGDRRFSETTDNVAEPVERKRRRLSSPDTSVSPADLFGKECQLCGKERVQVKGSRIKPHKILTRVAEAAIKNAAKSKDPVHYFDIVNVDLVTKDYKVHNSCYKRFVKPTTVATKSNKSSTSSASSTSNGNEEKIGCPSYETSNFAEVKEFVSDVILGDQRAVSIASLHEIYGLGIGDSRYRSKLKQRLKAEFSDKICFLSSEDNKPEIVVATESLTSTSRLYHDPERIVSKAGEIIQEAIQQKFKDTPELTWPPDLDVINSQTFKPPNILLKLIKTILTTSKNRASRSMSIDRLTHSIAEDIVFCCMKGKVFQTKHLLLGLGLHNLTGSRMVIDLLNRLGHSISYNSVCDIETAQAEAAQEAAKSTSVLPYQPSSITALFAHYWIDNFDIKTDKEIGERSIHTTHMMAFQNIKPSDNVRKTPALSVPKPKSRKIFVDDLNVGSITIERKKDPLINFQQQPDLCDSSSFDQKYLLWLVLRYQCNTNQQIAAFKGWNLKQNMENSKEKPIKTTETYLPPINSKVTEFRTILQYLQYLQNLSTTMNMKYVHVTMDVGAAINCYLMLWNNPDLFKNILVHLGGFHFLKENFQVLGDFVRGTGFKDVIFESDLCRMGSLEGVLAGSHYNRAWVIHDAFSEALERLLLRRFLFDKSPHIPHALRAVNFEMSKLDDKSSEGLDTFFKKYISYRKEVSTGTIGNTARFWMIYLDLIRAQTMAHTAIQENDWKSLMHCWKEFLPMYFILNKRNYARYGAYYYENMTNLKSNYPGAENDLSLNGISVQAQSNYPIMTAADQRGEQTINRDAKTTGGVKGFASDQMNVRKWCLN
ncbi:uncharacterized protein [Clytia hemisphaerica]|uniref:uncharacterized protein n=1 Tax=Clytia hemisphaerica TaxID=252671 RepID=UPI0034D41938